MEIKNGNGGSDATFRNDFNIGGDMKIDNKDGFDTLSFDGDGGFDTFTDLGGNTFTVGPPKVKKFEVVLP